MLLLRLAFFFIAIPLVELYLLLLVAKFTSLTMTVGIVVCTGMLGAYLAKQQGLLTVARIRQELNANQLPTRSLVDGAMILVAAAVLLTPGLLTDLFGFSLLVPSIRRFYIKLLLQSSWLKSKTNYGRPPNKIDPNVIDGQARETRR